MKYSKAICLTVVASLFLLSTGCSKKQNASFSLSSPDVQNGGALPQQFAYPSCGGDNQHPALVWSNPPAATRSFAVTLIDLNVQGFTHWIMYDIPASVTSMTAGSAPDGTVQAQNSYGEAGYGGPCPPAGSTHSYQFKVWALDVANVSEINGFVANSTGEFIDSLGNHVLGTASFDAALSY